MSLAHIGRLLRGESTGPSETWTDQPVYHRAAAALASGSTASALDVAVLVRQALRYNWRHAETRDELHSPAAGGGLVPSHAEWARVGVAARPIGDHLALSATPWWPEWCGPA